MSTRSNTRETAAGVPAGKTSQVLSTLRYVAHEVRQSAPAAAVMCVLLAVVLALTEGVGLLMLMPLLELIGVIEENPVPRVEGWLSQQLGVFGLVPSLGVVLAMFVTVAVMRSLALRWQVRLQAEVREQLTAQLRVRLFRAIGDAEWRFLASRSPHDFSHALTSEIGAAGNAAIRMFELSTALVIAAVYVGVAIRIAPGPATLVMVSAVMLALVARESLREARGPVGDAAGSRRLLHSTIAEHLASIKSAKAAGAIALHARLIGEVSDNLRRASVRVAGSDSDLHHRLEIGATVFLALTVYVSVSALGVSPTVLLLLLYVFARLMPRVTGLYRLTQALASSAPSVESLIHLERECRDASEPAEEGSDPVAAVHHSIQLEAVSFSYEGREPQLALDRIDLSLAVGRTTAIVGASGSGKSTLADVITGLLSPVTGRMLVDGVELTPAKRLSWRGQVGYVAQDAFFFDDTIRRNLMLGQRATDDQLWRCLELAAADRFVAALPEGLDARVGDRGSHLSGGERQRLAIARALLKQPRLLVLDEATSALDPENAARIHEAIDRLQHQMTILIISHRIEMVERADVIHVLDGGRLVQSGAWPDLITQHHGRLTKLLRSGRAAAVHAR